MRMQAQEWLKGSGKNLRMAALAFVSLVLADLLAVISINDVLVSRVHGSGWLWLFLYAYAFRIYRNYDGSGSTFGETGVQAASADQDKPSHFATQFVLIPPADVNQPPA